jgi:hypothetical protein
MIESPRKIMMIDTNGYFVEEKIQDSFYTLQENELDASVVGTPVGLHAPKWDGTEWVEGKSDIELLTMAQQSKLNELYSSYQQELSGQVVSSLIGADGANIVFPYEPKNRDDYRSIGVKFSLNTALTESIIGSDSHGKFYITREDFVSLVSDFDNHETNLYLKFKELKTQVESVTIIADVEAIMW